MAGTIINGVERIGMGNVTLVTGTSKVETTAQFGDIMAGVLQESTADSSKNFADTFKVKSSSNLSAETPVKNSNVKTENVKPKEELAADNADEINAAAGKVADKIKETLDVSDEELKESMEVLGLSMVDLLQPGNIAKLLMQLTGVEDSMLLITDPELSAAFKDIMSCLDNVLDNLAQQMGVSKEDMSAVIESMSGDGMNVDEQVAQSADDAIQLQTDETAQAETEQGTSIEDAIDQKLTVETKSASEANSDKKDATNNSSGMNMMNNEFGNQAGSVTQNISQAFETAFTGAFDNVNAADVVRQVVDSIKLTNTQALQSMEVQLTPENLGKVNILVSVREGVITAQITAESEQIKRALESQMLTLKENFENQGLKVEAVEVTVRNSAFENNPNFNNNSEQQEDTAKSKRVLRLDELDFSDDEFESEQSQQNIPVSENSSVEYMA